MSKITTNGALIAAAVAASLAVLPTMTLADSTPAPTTHQASNSCCHSKSTKAASATCKSTTKCGKTTTTK